MLEIERLRKKVDELEVQKIVLQFEVKKLTEKVICLQYKLNEKTLNDFGCIANDEDENDFKSN